MMEQPLRIFISYSSKDDELSNGWIQGFRDMLEAEIAANNPEIKCDIFFAARSIKSGEDWHAKYISKIDDSLDFFIGFVSPQYLSSKYCIEEMNKGLDLVRNSWTGRIIPIYFNGSGSMDSLIQQSSHELSENLSKYNYLDWRSLRFTTIKDPSSRQAVAHLVEDILSSQVPTSNSRKGKKSTPGSNAPIPVTEAKNDEVFIRQENRYDSAFRQILNYCAEQCAPDKQLIILELDYRKPKSLKRHLQFYGTLKRELGEVFVLCGTEEAYEQLLNEPIPKVTPFLLPREKFDVIPLLSLWEDNGYPKVDIIYSDRNYRYFSDPELAMLQIRKSLLSDHGGIAIKGFDDGSKICYPDPNDLMKKIIERTISKDRVSDRFNGRKLYHRFKLAGYDQIHIEYVLNDTASMDVYQRNELYEESFDFRKNYFSDDPEKLAEMLNDLRLLRNMFLEDSFYYCELNFYAAAVK